MIITTSYQSRDKTEHHGYLRSILKDGELIKGIDEQEFSKVSENATKETKAQCNIISGVVDSHFEYLKLKDNAHLIKKKELQRKFRDLKYNE